MQAQVFQRFTQYQPTKTQAFWIAVICVLATLIAGFGIGGWVTGTKAEKMVAEAADGARRDLGVAVCIEDFMHSPAAKAELAKLKKASWYDRGQIVSAGGWATMPDRKEPESAIAAQCAARLSEAPEAAMTPVNAAR
jgi:hypothetical protein